MVESSKHAISTAIAQTTVRALVTVSSVAAFLAVATGFVSPEGVDVSQLREFALYASAFYFGRETATS